MLRVILFSLLALVGIWFIAQGLGLTPEQAEAQILLAELNEEAGAAYRRVNATRPGVVELPSGVQVEIVRAGNGRVPGVEDWVAVHYRGWHTDGRLFESSHRLGVPSQIAVARTISGWQQVLTEIEEGTVARIVIPPQHAYGRAGGGRIGPEETLIFEVELLGIVEPPQRLPDDDPLQHPVPGLGGLDQGVMKLSQRIHAAVTDAADTVHRDSRVVTVHRLAS